MTGVIYIVKYSVNSTNLKQNQNSNNKNPHFKLLMAIFNNSQTSKC